MTDLKTDDAGASASRPKNTDDTTSDEIHEKQTSPDPSSHVSIDEEEPNGSPTATKPRSRIRKLYETIFWTPPNLRWDPKRPPKFSMALNVLFGFAGAFTVANLYYSHPILNILAKDFGVEYVEVSNIPTLAQAGYAVGLLFLCPLGDLLERRPFVLSLVFFTATLR